MIYLPHNGRFFVLKLKMAASFENFVIP